jgi:adenylate kinase
MYVLLLGAPGAGKGTQAEAIVREFGYKHVASGDVMRAMREEQSELGAKVREYYDKGLLVPDDVVIEAMLSRVSGDEPGYLLDGFPRTLPQAEALDAALARNGRQIDTVVYINVSEDELLDRLTGRWICPNSDAVYHEKYRPPKTAGVCDLCGARLYQRPDDTREAAQTRLKVYFDQTAPLIEYYRRRGVLLEVNGEQPIDAVERDLLAALRARKRTSTPPARPAGAES